jgi:glycosyltransferase involved in cell wall biosynthesis
MRILAITNLYPRPGHEASAAFNRQQFRALSAEHDLAVVAPVPWTEGLRDRWAGRGAPRHVRNPDGVAISYPLFYFPPRVLRHRYGEFFLISIRREVERLLHEHRPEVLLGCWAHPDGWATVRIARWAGLPVVVKVVGTDVLGAAARDPRRRRRIAEGLSQAEGVLAVSRDLADHVVRLGIDPARVHVVPEGVDTVLFRPGGRSAARARLGLPQEGRIVLFVGHLWLTKGLGVLAESCALLRDRGVPFHCYLVGRGPDEARVRNLIARHHVGGLMTLVGTRAHDDLPDWYRACDFVVLPSFSEGIPNVLREAMACGRSFVATRVGGIPEIAALADGRLVAPGSAVELADAMEETLACPPEVDAWRVRAGLISFEESARRLSDRLRAAAAGPSRAPEPRRFSLHPLAFLGRPRMRKEATPRGPLATDGPGGYSCVS